MSHEELTLRRFVEEVKEVSSGSRQRKFCFVLGAGASKTSGIKTGQDLVNIWEKELLEGNRESYLKWKEKLGINEDNKYEFYSEYYEYRFKCVDDGYNYLEKLMESAKPSIGYVILAYILTHTNHNVVITTNFDHLMEDAINYYEHTIPLVIGHESLANYIIKHINRPMVIKIHRDLLLEPQNRVAELDVLHENWKNALDTIFSEYYPIFIGYAGNDHSLMDYLMQNSTVFSAPNGTFPYWMIYKTDQMRIMVSEFLDKSNGYLIQHNGFDDVLCLLGSKLGYQVPHKEEFINDAGKRYQMLADSIDAYTERTSNEQEIDKSSDYTSDDAEKESLEVKQTILHLVSHMEPQKLFSDAIELVKDDKLSEARDIFKKLIGIEPQNARYHAWLGSVLEQMQQYENAKNELQMALKLEPTNAQYHVCLGLILNEMCCYEDARDEVLEALKLEPDNAEYHYSLSVTFLKMGCYKDARIEGQRAVMLAPDCAKYYNGLGIALYYLHYNKATLKIRKRAVELEPANASYHASFGSILYEMEYYEDARNEIQIALKLKPDNAGYHALLSLILQKMKCYEESRNEIEMALKLEPTNAEYHCRLSEILQDLKCYEQALIEATKTLALDSTNKFYYHNLYTVLQELGRYEDAWRVKQNKDDWRYV